MEIALPSLIELNDTEPLRVVHIVAEDRCTLAGFGIVYRILQAGIQTLPGENVVAKYHGYGVIPDKFFADQECLGQSVRTWLHFIGEVYAELMSVTEQLAGSAACPAEWR